MSFKQIDCFNMNVMFWKFIGIWPEKTSSKCYRYYSIFITISIYIVISILTTLNFFFLPSQLDLVIEEMLFYFTDLTIIAKVLTILYMHSYIQDIFDILECEIFQPETDDTLKIIKDAKKLIKLIYKVMAMVSYTSNLTHIISPVIAHIFLPIGLDLPVCSYSFISENIKEILIYPLYFYQSFGMHFHMLVNVNTDSFLCGVMILTIAQLEVLDCNLRHISDYNNETADNEYEKEEYLKLRLKKCILHFSEIERLCNLIEKVFSICMFVQFSASSCVICVSLFRFTLPAARSYYIFLTTYMAVMVIQIMMPCWFGTQIRETSSALSVAVYNCDWTPRSPQFKSSMILFVERMKRPLSVTGLKMFPLLLTTFSKIMNTAYSFYTLLRNMQIRE